MLPTRGRISRAVFVKAGFVVGLANATAWGQAPSITDLGILPGWEHTRANAMSSDGSTIVGWCHTGTTGGRAFRWTAAAGMADLGAFPGEVSAVATDVSRDGSVIAGWSGREGVNPRAFRWTASGGMQDLGGPPGGSWSFAHGISQDGAVITGTGGGGSFSALRWAAGEGMHILGPGEAYDANGDGSVVVGESARYAFRWTQQLGLQSLGALPASTGSHASVVSDDGSVVGGVSTAVGNIRVFRWTESGGMQDLGLLPMARGANVHATTPDGAAFVGECRFPGAPSRAFLWTEALGMVDLNSYLPSLGVDLSGWTLTTATGISEDQAVLSGSGLHDGEQRGWVVVIPSPGTAAAVSACWLSVGRRRRRSRGAPGAE